MSSIVAALSPAAAALVWGIAIFCALIFVYRRITGAGRDDKPVLEEPMPSLDSIVPPPPRPAPGAPTSYFVEGGGEAPTVPPVAPSSPTPQAAVPPPAAAPDTTAPAAPADGRTGFFAPSTARSTGGATGGVRPTVAEALRGIDMPCGLSPVIDGSSSIPNPFRAAFLTTEADAVTVGSSVGDELERLGYALTTSTPTEVLARRDGSELRVVLYPSPATATRGLDTLFPAAPPASVGIEFST